MIPNSVTNIGNRAFAWCTSLTSIMIPDSVESIGENAFNSCTSLTNVTIPNGVISIGSSAFYSCSGLTSVTISNSVTSIGYGAFSDCIDLTSIIFKGKTLDQVKAMDSYPWGIKDESIIKCESVDKNSVDESFCKEKMLTEGKHWPEDYIKTAYNLIKQSKLGQTSWYSDEYILRDLIGPPIDPNASRQQPVHNINGIDKQDLNRNPHNYGILGDFSPLMHKNSNLGFFSTIARWFIEYSGDSSQRYQEFIERKLGKIIAALLKIRADKAYDTKADEIKKMNFSQFEKLMDEVNSKEADDVSSIVSSNAKSDVVPIYSYEELNKRYGGNLTGWHGDSEWCHTNR